MFRLYPAALAALIACSKGTGGAPPAPPPRPVEVLTMAPTEVRDTGEYLGSLLSRGSVSVMSQVPGYVRAIKVKPGQQVAAGDVLIEIDSREASAAVNSASAEVQSANAALALARQTLARIEALHGQGVVSDQEVDQRRADVAAAQAALRAAGAQVSQRRVALSNHVIRAAVPGDIGEVQIRIGDFVTPTTPLTTIGKANVLELTVAIPAARARGLQPGAPIEILGEDGKVLVASTLFYVATEADPRTQLVEVKASIDNTVGLRPQEMVRARLVYKVDKALQVPLLAVVRQSGKSFVFAVADKDGQLVVERRPVELAELSGGGYRVDKGLAAGDRIAVSSLQSLRDGAPVTIQPQGQPPR
ncbi:MAG TPA: efflux RND transporter periplasmic adaptor subunit [Kofleriaceae bacterium]|nr:efflux RND transporter periplasmic adaptor subunit [Kofleriaceae bacterium]